ALRVAHPPHPARAGPVADVKALGGIAKGVPRVLHGIAADQAVCRRPGGPALAGDCHRNDFDGHQKFVLRPRSSYMRPRKARTAGVASSGLISLCSTSTRAISATER